MKRTGLNIICSLLLVGGMCACTATPKQTEEIKWSERMAQSEMQRFPEPWMIKKEKKPYRNFMRNHLYGSFPLSYTDNRNR